MATISDMITIAWSRLNSHPRRTSCYILG